MQDPSVLKEIEFYLGDPKEGSRKGLVSMLRNMGLRNINAFDSAEKLTAALMQRTPDFVLMSSDLHDDVFSLLKKIRHHEFGRNPFTVISMIIEQDNAAHLNGAMKSGADDVLSNPVSASHVMDRLKRVAFNRLPFIAMPDYIGPDRRKDEQRKMNVPVFDVLNTLKGKMEGKTFTESAIAANVAQQMHSVRAAQLEGFSYKLGFLCKAILKSYETRPLEDDVAKKLAVLHSSLHKAADVATKGSEPGLARTCSVFADKVGAMRDHVDEPSEDELKLLDTLTRAYQMAREDISGQQKPH